SESARAQTGAPVKRGFSIGRCGPTGHIRTVPSLAPEISVLPSRVKATELTWATWPWKILMRLPDATSQRLTVSSQQAVPRVLPSGEKAMEYTAAECLSL